MNPANVSSSHSKPDLATATARSEQSTNNPKPDASSPGAGTSSALEHDVKSVEQHASESAIHPVALPTTGLGSYTVSSDSTSSATIASVRHLSGATISKMPDEDPK